jgi:GNAT superfamily N-acetyltransferase
MTFPTDIVLRAPESGDLGWVIEQHGRIYAQEYGWNWEFEALVAGICADFVRNFQPEWERCWIAERVSAGQRERLGSVFVVRQDAQTAKLRMLILTPQARGTGLGQRLTDEAIAFARAKGYTKMVLWTNACLLAARAIYVKRGFVLTHSEPTMAFGAEQTSETWELMLGQPT